MFSKFRRSRAARSRTAVVVTGGWVPWAEPAADEAISAMAARAGAINSAEVHLREPEAFASWQSGTLRPWRLTAAFNAAGATGAWVDRACGTVEPDIDAWEAGTRYPTWDGIARVAALTGIPLAVLFRDDDIGAPNEFARCFNAIVARSQRLQFLAELVAVTVEAYPLRPGDDAVREAHRIGTETKYADQFAAIRRTRPRLPR